MALSVPVVAAPVPVPGHPMSTGSPAAPFPAWPALVLGMPIVLRFAIFVAVLVTEPWVASPNRSVPPWAQIVQSSLFASLAFVLIYYGRADRRAWSLGLFILDAASTLLTPFVLGIRDPSALVWLGLHLRTDAFQAALLWFFAGVFPKPFVKRSLAIALNVGTGLAFALGLILVVLDTYAIAVGESGSAFGRIAQSFQRQSPGPSDWYFSLQFLSLVPLLALMPLKLRESGPNDRRRFMWLALGIVVGFLPLAINTILVTVWPWYADASGARPQVRVRDTLIVLALTAVPIAGAYAALVQRTLDVRLVMRAALQYLLARSFIRIAAAAPFVVLVLLIAINRERSVMQLMSGPLGLTLAGLTAAGLAAAASRRRLMTTLDARFFRREIDARATLLSVTEAVRYAESLDELRDTIAGAIDDAFHPVTLATAVAGSDDSLHAIDAELPPLPRGSALAQLLAVSDTPLDVEGRAAPIVERLGVLDRDWLAVAGAKVVMPLRGSTAALMGVVALGEKKSEVGYQAEDLALLAAVGGACGLALDRILAAVRDGRQGTGPALAEPAARECVECGSLFDADTIACYCGGLLQRAATPHRLGDRLGFVRRIGTGGMAVVYLARDLRLQQPRAVKTLPGSDPVMMARLRREARTMAAAKHPNLATLHGLETWRGAPLLVMEFLEGGTLADRLQKAVVPVDEVLQLGQRVASALDVLHNTGILHRDIKPSNIGFTKDGTPKLLDFGLAKLSASHPHAAAPNAADSTLSVSISSGVHGIRGTPAYLSPEILGGTPPSARDDLWSLGVTLLETCTGNNPFRAATIAATIARVLTDKHRVEEATSTLPDRARLLFQDLLGPLDRRPQTAQQFGARLTMCAREGEH